MSLKVYWLQCGGCGGDTWSFFNAESPNIVELFDSFHIELLWHPTISIDSRRDPIKLNQDLISGEQELDVLCIEGSILRGPGGTGRFDEVYGKDFKMLQRLGFSNDDGERITLTDRGTNWLHA